MRYRPERLPPDIRELVGAFDQGLREALGRNAIAAYLLGSSVVEEGRRRHSGDVDFFVVTRRALSRQELAKLGHLHERLAQTYPFGDELDGLYVTAGRFRSGRRLLGVGFDTAGRHRQAVDGMWAIHRAHLRGGACLVLRGLLPERAVASVTWPEIAAELDKELRLIRKVWKRHPVYCTLNLCRLMYSWKAKDPVISKRAAAAWACRWLPPGWRASVRSALRLYDHRGRQDDRELLLKHLAGFLRFADNSIERAKSSRPSES